MKYLLYIIFLFPLAAIAQYDADFSHIRIAYSGTLTTSRPSMTLTGAFGSAGTADTLVVTFTGAAKNFAVTGPYEVSTNGGSTYAGTGSFSTGSPLTLKVRTTAAAPGGSGSGSISFTGSDIATVNVTITSTVTSTLSASPTTITGLNGTAGTAGTPQTVTVTFTGNTVTATPPSGTELSINAGSSYSGSAQTFSTGSPLATLLRTAAATAAGSISGNLTYSEPGATTVTIPVSGTVSASTVTGFMFSKTAQTTPAGFTNAAGDPHAGVVTATANGITVSSVATANWSGYTNISAFDGNGVTGSTMADFPDPVLASIWVNYSGSSNLADSATMGLGKPQIQMSGLTPAGVYTVNIGTSMSNSLGFTVTNKIRIVGAATYISPTAINAKGNTSIEQTFTCTADGSGILKFYVNTEPGQQAAVINTISIHP